MYKQHLQQVHSVSPPDWHSCLKNEILLYINLSEANNIPDYEFQALLSMVTTKRLWPHSCFFLVR